MTTPPNDVLDRARAALATGDVDAIAELWCEIRSGGPTDGDDAFAWLLVLVEAGLLAEAGTLLPVVDGTRHAIAARAVLSPLATLDVGGTQDDDSLLDPSVDLPQKPAPDRELIDMFLRWFGGRRDIYARQWYDDGRRRSGYHPVHEPITDDVVVAHIDGHTTIGQYLLFPDGSAAVGVIDLDVDAGALAQWRATRDGESSAAAFPPLRDWALRLIEAARSLGLPVFPEDSGGKGMHLWIFFAPRRPARAVRAVLGAVVAASGPQPADVKIEVFPKQDRPGPKGLSSLVKLPLGLHRATLRRCFLLGDDLLPIDDARGALRRLAAPAADIVADVIGRRLVALPLPAAAAPGPLPPLSTVGNPRSLAEALRLVGPSDQGPACERVIGGCRILRGFVAKAFDQHTLAPAEARAILYTIGLVGRAPQIIEDIFAAARQPKSGIERISRGLPAPTGCQRLRLIGAPEACDGCRCPQGQDATPYATPTLFAVGTVGPGQPTWKPFSAWLVDEVFAPDTSGPDIERRVTTLEHKVEKMGASDGEDP